MGPKKPNSIGLKPKPSVDYNQSVSDSTQCLIPVSEPDLPQDSNETTVVERRQCWLCLDEEESEKPSNTSRGQQLVDDWLSPCRCRGSLKWVHNKCLQQWIDEKQSYEPNATAECTVCHTPYLIINRPKGKFVELLEFLESVIESIVTPLVLLIFASIVILFINVYNYGNNTCVQSNVSQKTTELKFSVLLTKIGLQLISIVSNLALNLLTHRLQNSIIRQLLRYYRLPIPKLNGRSFTDVFIRVLMFLDLSLEFHLFMQRINNGNSQTKADLFLAFMYRFFWGAILLPNFARLCGHCLYGLFDTDLYQTLLGGLLFIVIRGSLKIYLRLQQVIRHSNRTILNYSEHYGSEEQN